MRRVTKDFYVGRPYLFAVEDFTVDHVETEYGISMVHDLVVLVALVSLIDS